MPSRRSQAFALLLATTILGHASLSNAQDFDPAGRRRRPPASAPSQPRTPRAPRQAAAPPSQDALIARYLGLVLAQPGVPFPLQRLAQLYRERDGHAGQLVVDLETRARAAEKDAWGAQIALAGVYRLEGKLDEAQAAYEAAIDERPKQVAPLMALASLHRDRGQLAEARARYEQSLSVAPQAEREEILRILLTLALDLGDHEGAERAHRLLIQEHPSSFFIRGELARELLLRGDGSRAEAELRRLLTTAGSDSRTLPVVLRDLGQALALQGKDEEALAIFERAEKAAGSASGVRNEVFERIVALHRQRGEIPRLIERLEREGVRDPIRALKVGELYEEVGQVDEALAAYEKASRLDPKGVEPRLATIRLLHARGSIDRAIAEYEALIRISSRKTEYVFELAKMLIQRGERGRALSMMAEVERRIRNEPDAVAALVDFYDSIGEKEKALALSRKLSQSSRDPYHLVDLGERYWQEGDKKRALETWSRIALVAPSRARAKLIVGEVYLDHEMIDEGLAALSEAVTLEPGNLAHQRALATALERAATGAEPKIATERYERALAIWQKLLDGSKNDPRLAREARTHIVTIWAFTKKTSAELPRLRARFEETPPDLESGRLLAEAYLRARRFEEAEATLSRLSELSPGDVDLLLSLERVYVLRRDLERAIEVLKKVVVADPRRAREAYRKMAEYAAELYRDDEALLYAEEAVALAPEDAEGHRKLGELYRKRQEPEKAILSLRTAIAKNDLAFSVYFELADLLLASGQADEADALYRRILRTCPDEGFILQAARKAIELSLARGRLETLEEELLRAVLGDARKTVHRRVLVELYGEMSLPWVQAWLHGLPSERATARERLEALGARALKPLLDALGDPRTAQQRIAVEILSVANQRAAGSALFTFALGDADPRLREQAMRACGTLRDPSLLPRYRELLLPEGLPPSPSDPVVLAAAFGLAWMEAPEAKPLLVSLLSEGPLPVRAIAAHGLAKLGDRSALVEMTRLATQASAPPLVRTAAATALAQLGSKEAVPILLLAARGGDRRARQASVLALARMRAEAAEEVVAEALFSMDAELRSLAEDAARMLDEGQTAEPFDPLALPAGRLDLAAMLIAPRAEALSAEARAGIYIRLAPSLRRAALSLSMTSPEEASAVAHTLDTLRELSAELAEASLRSALNETVAAVASALVPVFVSLERHPSIEVRVGAVQFLAGWSEERAQAAILDALDDPEVRVKLATLSVLTPGAGPNVVAKVIAHLASAPDWPSRARAAEALGRIAERDSALAFDALTEAAKGDDFALVREAALRALARLDRVRAAPVLEAARTSDAEPRIRELARQLLEAAAS